jgi:hypothetical protein
MTFGPRVAVLVICFVGWAGLLFSIRELDVNSPAFRVRFWSGYGLMFIGLLWFCLGLWS